MECLLYDGHYTASYLVYHKFSQQPVSRGLRLIKEREFIQDSTVASAGAGIPCRTVCAKTLPTEYCTLLIISDTVHREQGCPQCRRICPWTIAHIEYYFLFKVYCWFNKWNMLAHVNLLCFQMLVLFGFLISESSDSSALSWGSFKRQGWAGVFLWIISLGKGEGIISFWALILVFIYIPISRGVDKFPVILTQEIIKHVLFPFLPFIFFFKNLWLLTILRLGVKLSSLAKCLFWLIGNRKNQTNDFHNGRCPGKYHMGLWGQGMFAVVVCVHPRGSINSFLYTRGSRE